MCAQKESYCALSYGTRFQIQSKMCDQSQRAMVLVHVPELKCNVWQDFICTAHRQSGLLKHLQDGVKQGKFLGYRMMRIEKEVLANE